MKYLATFIGQGKIFVRPIQVDLAMESDTPKKNMEIQKEKCKRCEAILDVYVLREHYATCSRQVNSAQVSLYTFFIMAAHLFIFFLFMIIVLSFQRKALLNFAHAIAVKKANNY